MESKDEWWLRKAKSNEGLEVVYNVKQCVSVGQVRRKTVRKRHMVVVVVADAGRSAAKVPSLILGCQAGID